MVSSRTQQIDSKPLSHAEISLGLFLTLRSGWQLNSMVCSYLFIFCFTALSFAVMFRAAEGNTSLEVSISSVSFAGKLNHLGDVCSFQTKAG